MACVSGCHYSLGAAGREITMLSRRKRADVLLHTVQFVGMTASQINRFTTCTPCCTPIPIILGHP